MAGYGRHGDDAYDNLGSQYEGWLDGKSKWPCMNPECDQWVDPDDVMQYCSKGCEHRAMAFEGKTYAMREEAKLKTTTEWVKRNVPSLNSLVAPPDFRAVDAKVEHTRQPDTAVNARSLQSEVMANLFGF